MYLLESSATHCFFHSSIADLSPYPKPRLDRHFSILEPSALTAVKRLATLINLGNVHRRRPQTIHQ